MIDEVIQKYEALALGARTTAENAALEGAKVRAGLADLNRQVSEAREKILVWGDNVVGTWVDSLVYGNDAAARISAREAEIAEREQFLRRAAGIRQELERRLRECERETGRSKTIEGQLSKLRKYKQLRSDLLATEWTVVNEVSCFEGLHALRQAAMDIDPHGPLRRDFEETIELLQKQNLRFDIGRQR
jgi:hypothetical protein